MRGIDHPCVQFRFTQVDRLTADSLQIPTPGLAVRVELILPSAAAAAAAAGAARERSWVIDALDKEETSE